MEDFIGCIVAHIAHTFVFAARVRMIRIDQKSFRRNLGIVDIDLAPLRIVDFIIGSTSFRVDDTEVGLNAAGLLHLVEHLFEVLQGLAGTQCLIHHDTFLVFKISIFALQIVGSRIHDRETDFIGAIPDFAILHRAVDQSEETVFTAAAGREEFDAVVQFTGITMLPE